MTIDRIPSYSRRHDDSADVIQREHHLARRMAGRLIFGAYLGVVMAHFVIDAGLCRMRDPLARAFLISHLPALAPVPGPAITSTDPSLADIGCTP